MEYTERVHFNIGEDTWKMSGTLGQMEPAPTTRLYPVLLFDVLNKGLKSDSLSQIFKLF